MFSWMKMAVAISLFILGSCQSHDIRHRSVAQDNSKYFDRLVDYTPYKYEVLFTNPECGIYNYTNVIRSQSGKILKHKPANVYCKNKYDARRSSEREQSPQYRLIEWISQPEVKEIFFTYLSFRNKAVKNALCAAAKNGVKIKFIISSTEDQTTGRELVACSPENVEMKTRGMEGGLGYAHNKFLIINPNDQKEFKVVFSSGNMTSGPVLHHENWNFITTHPISYFAQSHLCAVEAAWNDQTGRTKNQYVRAIQSCRANIQAPEEKDIKVFFVPAEGEPMKANKNANDKKRTALDYLIEGDLDLKAPGIKNAQRIWIACHRFFYSKMINALSEQMSTGPKKNRPDLRIVCDDDTYYKVNDPDFTVGDTMPVEYYRMQNLAKKGAKLKFMETNAEEHQLHHSKFLIFADQKSENNSGSDSELDLALDFKAVFTGSANLTGAGFSKNMENSYYITIPEVVQAFARQYIYTWEKLATAEKDLPQKGMVSSHLSDKPIISDFREPASQQKSQDQTLENLFSQVLPPVPENVDSEKIWSSYCLANRKSADIPKPNYKNAEVISAVKKLSLVSPYSFYFYSGPLLSYNLKKGKNLVDPPADFPNVTEVKNGRKNAHAFMTLLCGEFRDRPTLIKDKIRWVNRMYTLPAVPRDRPINLRHELWSQVSAHDYMNYIDNSKAIFSAKKSQAREFKIRLGSYEEDVPIEPFSICETKFIFKSYVDTKSYFEPDQFKTYQKQYQKFKKQCSDDDLNYIYDFRGDSNFKPNSPESNAMIWYASTITNNCTRTSDGRYVLKDKAKNLVSDPLICEKYLQFPFSYRWAAARAGLATWLLHDKNHDSAFADTSERVHIVPHFNPAEGPFSFKLSSEDILSDLLKTWSDRKTEFWHRSDFGFNALADLGTAKADRGFVFERLRDAVNRHTDWYRSGYEDGLGIIRTEAYSPFVASSYEMSASDAFTAPGLTVKSPSDGCKHWMFVFKLKKDQWYNTQSLKQKKKINFNYHWFDETSFGTNHLADSEHAFDRLGTALEGETDVILYLHNIDRGGNVNETCGEEGLSLTTGSEGKE